MRAPASTPDLARRATTRVAPTNVAIHLVDVGRVRKPRPNERAGHLRSVAIVVVIAVVVVMMPDHDNLVMMIVTVVMPDDENPVMMILVMIAMVDHDQLVMPIAIAIMVAVADVDGDAALLGNHHWLVACRRPGQGRDAQDCKRACD